MSEEILRRSKLELEIDVLNTVNNGAFKPTRIMYACNLSWEVLKRTLEKLISKDLILVTTYSANIRTKKKYTITDKGVKVIDAFNDMKLLIN